jgi:hypothetical protein
MEFGKLVQPYFQRFEESLKGTTAEPLVNKRREVMKEALVASKAGENDKAAVIAGQVRPIDIEINRMVKGVPICQFRWVATNGDVSAEVDILTNRDGDKTFRLLKPVALDEHEVKSAGFTDFKPDRKDLSVYLFAPAGKRFYAEASKHFGQSLAMTWREQVVAALNVSQYSYDNVILSGILSDAEAQELLDILNHQMQTDPGDHVSQRH